MRFILLTGWLLLSTPVPFLAAQSSPTSGAADKSTPIFVCLTKTSKAYHVNRVCQGLNECTKRIIRSSKAKAVRLGRHPCRLSDCTQFLGTRSGAADLESPESTSFPLPALGLSGLLLSFVGLRRLAQKKKRAARTLQFRVALVAVEQAEACFNHFTTYRSGYFNQRKLVDWKAQHQALQQQVEHALREPHDLSAAEAAAAATFLEHFQQGEAQRQAFNAAAEPQELQRYDALFSHVEGRSLDLQQRTAIVRDEDNSLVIAGAGSGKTTTIIGKVKYVLDRYATPPGRVLLISFTNLSAATLTERIGVAGIEPKTFHKFGKDVISAVEGKQPSLYDESQFGAFVSATFEELMHTPAYAAQVTAFFLQYLKPVKAWEDFQHQGEYIQHLKDNVRSYKQIARERNGKLTYQQEVVKSVEECHIANFLLMHGVDYQYEAPYEHNTATSEQAQWKPDFTLRQGATTVYLEHFGVDRQGNVPAFFAGNGQSLEQARARYRRKMDWARQTSARHGTALVESFSYEMFEGTLFDTLRANLARHGIVLQPKPPEAQWAIITAAAEQEVNSFTALLQTFLTLLKSTNQSVQQVRAQIAAGPRAQQARNERFLAVVAPVLARYEQLLTQRREIDFSDLINRATAYIQSGAYRQPFDYLVVDEFQDISRSRYQLLKAIQDQNPQCKLFCVGDDWQSIYRFAGSDLSLFKEFEKYFGFTLKSRIETTYRFHEPLIGASSRFITKNPHQTPKSLRSGSRGKRTDFRIVYHSSAEQDDTAVLKQVLHELIATVPHIERKEIMVLGRYAANRHRIKNRCRSFVGQAHDPRLTYAYRDAAGSRGALHLSFMTVHKSKGLEADIVILLNCTAGKYGFPAEMADDPVLDVLLPAADRYENGEERRLFYVALTRAKEQVILVTDPVIKSKFIAELEVPSPAGAVRKCPRCRTADLVPRTSRSTGKTFYGCINYAYGCEHRESVG